ncbi:MAG TPA: hypothetical protein VGO79_09515 [Thermoanaerobaculia bacterium]
MSRRQQEPRVLIEPRPGGLVVQIRPLARSRAWRVRMAAIGFAVAGAALVGSVRIGQTWEAGIRRWDFGDFPLPLLIFLTLAVLISTPLSLLGLAALAFAEERIEVAPDAVTVSTTAFERTRERRIPLAELDCWRETYWPLPPWWTWAVKRLAASAGGRLYAVAGAAGPREKRAIGEALAQATGRSLLGDFGRRIA